jgi:hypothetical protein
MGWLVSGIDKRTVRTQDTTRTKYSTTNNVVSSGEASSRWGVNAPKKTEFLRETVKNSSEQCRQL